MRARPITTAIAVIVLGIAIAAFAVIWRPAIDPIERPAPESFDKGLVARGAELAAIGNCSVCHTAPRGQPFAGGLPLPTPFGTIYSTNITPDPDTGIGRWSEAAFTRAMREGLDREGRHLYPAFPYDHFTHVTDEDNRALYAFFMTREPVKAEAPQNGLPFPLNIRAMVAGWKLLYFRPGPLEPDATKDTAWNRGAYLVEGLGHCGACHTPRNLLGAEKSGDAYAGGEAEGWHAYALDANSPAPVPWDVEALHAYLRQGWHPLHGVARGPMAPVTANLASVPDADVQAIATYVASLMGETAPERRQRGEKAMTAARVEAPGLKPASADSQAVPPFKASADQGAMIYAAACASCHEGGRAPPFGGLNLHLSSAMNASTPDNVINVVLQGVPALGGERGAIMPAFNGAMTDGQLAALLGYLRSTFSEQPAWTDVESHIREAREGARVVSSYATHTGGNAPTSGAQRGSTW
ncbi:c-type cytochrome [Chelatococcus sp. GCM10030263]|uniref:c-type cytochrome n=1 Tax=Chelatococcus sp. GCM10030263 TaxID=3273387 RepID=UPI00360AC196